MSFSDFNSRLRKHFRENFETQNVLFSVNVDKDEMWNLYLDSFPEGTNEIYRVRREMDCSCCRHFIKSIGNVVYISEPDYKVHTLWEFNIESQKYQPVVDALDKFIKANAIQNMYLSPVGKVGTEKSHENSDSGVITWEHFCVNLPNKFVENGYNINTYISQYRDTRNVFKRSLDEISDEAIDVVLELIFSNTLYKGEEWKNQISSLKKYKQEYSKLSNLQKENYVWLKSKEAGVVIGRIRNHSIGVLLVDISNGVELDEAVKRYERIVAPTNYKRPKAIFTKKMLEDAKKTVESLGYMDSLARRYATLDDITVNNILFSNKDSGKRIQGFSDVFDAMSNDCTTKNPKEFSRVQDISAEDFVENVLPTAKEVEAFVENRHANNFVSLIAPKNKDSKSMFKWNNGFSWAYTGNITDSNIKENVKNAGGSVTGVLRFSIQWNDDEYDNCDYDAHCKSPIYHIYYGDKYSLKDGGNLDVDITNPKRNVPAVENITWPRLDRMISGNYEFYVHCFCSRGNSHGFKAQIEFNGETYDFEYPYALRWGENVKVATVTLSNGKFSIKPHLTANGSVKSKEIWGVHTNNFVPVSVVMYSPNYWDEQEGIGHKHYMFMLKDCVNPENPNGFYNEFLKNDLDKHKRVFEALGGKMAVESVEDQLSGLGFSSTKRNDIVVRVKGATDRIMRVKF